MADAVVISREVAVVVPQAAAAQGGGAARVVMVLTVLPPETPSPQTGAALTQHQVVPLALLLQRQEVTVRIGVLTGQVVGQEVPRQ